MMNPHMIAMTIHCGEMQTDFRRRFCLVVLIVSM